MSDLATPRKTQIHAAAAALFSRNGFHATSVRDIGDEVGMQGASLYAHIESKDDLLWQIVADSADRFFAAIDPIVSSNRTTVQKIREAVVAHVTVITDDLDAAAVYSTEWRHLSDGRCEAFAKKRDEYEQRFRGLIDTAMRERLVNVADARLATLFVLSALNWIYQWYRPDGRLTADELGRLMADYVFDGLRRRTG